MLPDPPLAIDLPMSALLSRADLGVTYATANRLRSRLTAPAIVEETTGKSRGRVYRYEPYLDPFRE